MCRSFIAFSFVLFSVLPHSFSWKPSLSSFRWQKAAVASLCAVQLWLDPMNIDKQPAFAVVNQLADVGLKEFLVKDGRQWLRLNIPVGNDMKLGEKSQNDEIKQAQENLELVRLRLEQVGYSNKAVWGPCVKDAVVADGLIKKNHDALIAGTLQGSKKEVQTILDEQLLPTITELIAALRAQDITSTNTLQEAAGAQLGAIRLAQLPANKLPYTIPEEYNALPRLNGRAEVEMVIASGNKRGYRLEDGVTLVPKITLRMVVDGYHAPLTAGNFVDLVKKGFYDGMTLQKVEQLIVQTGLPATGNGYVDKKTGQIRQIPLEIFYKKDSAPVYSATSDDDMRATDAISMPFQAIGAMGMARGNEVKRLDFLLSVHTFPPVTFFSTLHHLSPLLPFQDVDSASSQFFFVKWDQGLIAPGRNTLDGFYTNFGYITENENILSQMTDNDKVISMKVVNGLSNLVTP